MQQITVGCALSQAWVDTELRASRKPELLASRLDSVRNRWQKERSCLIRYLLHKCEGPLGSPELMLNLMAPAYKPVLGRQDKQIHGAPYAE